MVLVGILISSGRIDKAELISFAILIPSIILHEIAHGAVATALGDDTARRAGRLSLNPKAHVDPMGSLIVPALMVLGGIGFVGWAKPVPINTAKLRSPRNGALAVALAGPMMNLVLAVVAYAGFTATFVVGSPTISGAALVFFYLGLVNLWLACFNLLPVPPLDGSSIIERFLPARAWPRYLHIRQYLFPVMIGLVLIDAVLHLGLLAHLSDWVFNWWANLLGV
jgi:Zn-dependent protease